MTTGHEASSAPLVHRCPDCQGTGRLALLISVVGCRTCSGSGTTGIDVPLFQLGLSVRTRYVLRKNGVHSLDQLLRCRDSELEAMPRWNDKLLAELRAALRHAGLSLRP
jgi:hypothetical protein